LAINAGSIELYPSVHVQYCVAAQDNSPLALTRDMQNCASSGMKKLYPKGMRKDETMSLHMPRRAAVPGQRQELAKSLAVF
jgi:hypothetical protein